MCAPMPTGSSSVRTERRSGNIPGALVNEEFEAYLKCGRLEYGLLRVKCDACQHEKPVAFSCKHRGFCPSCGARRMADTAAHLFEHVLPEQPIRQWVLSFPYPLRFLFATRPAVLELKRGRLHAEQVVRQLRAGAPAAEKLVPQGEAIMFRPIAASGSTPRHERTKLRSRASAIRFHGHVEPVRLMSCGAKLVMALR